MQSQDKNFEAQFRRQAEQLEVKPSAQNWDRLSSRLATQPGRSRRLQQGWIKLAAAVLLLAVLTTAYLALPGLSKPNVAYASSPQELEELPMSTEADLQQSKHLLAYDEIYRRIVSYPIAEGTSSRRLLPK